MNWDELAGTWKQFRGKVKEKFGKLAKSDVMTSAGKRDQSAGMLQQDYGSAKAQSKKRFGASAARPHPCQEFHSSKERPGSTLTSLGAKATGCLGKD